SAGLPTPSRLRWTWMDLDSLPAQLRPVLNALAAALRSREPAIRERVEKLSAEHPFDSPDELARRLIARTRRRIATTGAASGAAAGERMTVAALRTLPARTLTGPSTHRVGRVLSRVLGRRAVGAVVRVAPLAVGMAAGAGFDWLAVTALGRAAIRYYGPGGPALAALPPYREDGVEIESGG